MRLERGGCVVVEGPLDNPVSLALAQRALQSADPSLTVVRLDRAATPRPAIERAPAPFTPSAMVCRGSVCSAPVATAAELGALLTSPAAQA